jgi:23S rRNA (guanosine2251-2'-O)-methyltransferase
VPPRNPEASPEIPFRASPLSAAYDGIATLPVSIVLDSVRSLYNVGAFFRTLDAAGGAHLYLSGISATPPHAKLAKTALGADQTVSWSRVEDVPALIRDLQVADVTVAAIETHEAALDLYDWRPRFPVCLVFGHEVDGLSRPVVDACDVAVRIPMLGRKHSLNVATAGGIVVFELLRQYRDLARAGRRERRDDSGRGDRGGDGR